MIYLDIMADVVGIVHRGATQHIDRTCNLLRLKIYSSKTNFFLFTIYGAFFSKYTIYQQYSEVNG